MLAEHYELERENDSGSGIWFPVVGKFATIEAARRAISLKIIKRPHRIRRVLSEIVETIEPRVEPAKARPASEPPARARVRARAHG